MLDFTLEPVYPLGKAPLRDAYPAISTGDVAVDFQLSEYHRDLVAATRELARGKFGARAFAQDDEAGLPREYLTFLAEHGLAGITMPQEDGGQGGKLLDAVLVIETVAQISPVAGDCVQDLNFGAIQP